MAQVATAPQTFVVSAAAGAPTLVQSAGAYKTGGSTVSVTLPSAPTPGNRLLFVAHIANGGAPVAPSGFTLADSYGNYGTSIYWYTKVADGSETTATLTGTTLSYSVVYIEATPCGVATGAGALPSTASSPVAMATATPAVANTLALSLMAFSAAVGTVTPSSGWALVIQQVGAATGIRTLGVASKPQTAIAPVSGSWSFTPAGGSAATATVFLTP